MDRCQSFESFLHNPWKYPSKEESTAMLVFKRKERFVEGYNYFEDLQDLILTYFGNRENLEKYGLRKYYKELQHDVETNKLIGLILLGTEINQVPVKLNFINNYTTQTGNTIDLTIVSITQTLITEYIKKENVKKLCIATPNFQLYYDLKI